MVVIFAAHCVMCSLEIRLFKPNFHTLQFKHGHMCCHRHMWWMSLEIGLAITNCAQQQLLLGYDYPICRTPSFFPKKNLVCKKYKVCTYWQWVIKDGTLVRRIFSGILVTFLGNIWLLILLINGELCCGTEAIQRHHVFNVAWERKSGPAKSIMDTKGQRQQMVIIRDETVTGITLFLTP